MNTAKRIIIAGNQLQYFQYLHEKGYDRQESPLVVSMEQLRGYKDIPAHPVGTWYQLRDAADIREYVFAHNMTEHEELS